MDGGTGLPEFENNRGRRPSVAAATPWQVVWAGLLGFVAGAVCWHMIGFWGFVQEAVFFSRADGPAPIVQRTAGPPSKTQSRQAGLAGPVVVSRDGNCTLAGLNRATGGVEVAGCDGIPGKFHPARGTERADRGDFGATPVPTLISGAAPPAPAVGGWSARVDTTPMGPKRAE